MEQFSVEVACRGGGTPHTHTMHVEHGSGAYGVSAPAKVRLQYICPLTGEAFIAMFQPPVGAGRPFTVTKVQ